MGGKWVLAPWIIGQFPHHRIYCEPFGGGGNVLLRKPRSHVEIYNDLDGEIVNLFRVARDRSADLRAALEGTPFAREEFVRSYEASDDPVEQARRTVVRTFQGFCSTSYFRRTSFRASGKGRNGEHVREWTTFPAALDAIRDRLRGVIVENRKAETVIAQQDTPETLFYIDPPYTEGELDPGTRYRHRMDDADHSRLAALLANVAGTDGLSGRFRQRIAHHFTRLFRQSLPASHGRSGAGWLAGALRENPP